MDDRRQKDLALLLRSVDQRTLPYLVGDVLFHSLGHRDVRIVDGPGDGRRDVHSVTSEGEKHVAQCKFHNDPSSTVGARETDELPVALLKFGASCGMFATTGRLTPQAKREYLEQFKQFRLEFVEGLQLVDMVATHPVLRSIWLRGVPMSAATLVVGVPFIVRNVAEDAPTEVDVPEQSLLDGTEVKCPHERCDVMTFAPYRAPRRPNMSETGGATIWCRHLVFKGENHVFNVPTRVEQAEAIIVREVARLDGTHVVRIGQPYFAKLIEDDRDSPERAAYEPMDAHSVVVASQCEPVPEDTWILPSDREWEFPENVSVAEADWACWYSRRLDTWLRVELRTPISIFYSNNWLIQLTADKKEAALQQSLFVGGATTAIDTLLGAVVHQPQVVCKWGPGGKLAAWLLTDAVRDAGVLQVPGRPKQPDPNGDAQREADLKLIAEVWAAALQRDVQIIPWHRAEHLFAGEGHELLVRVQNDLFVPARLIHYPEELPSPANFAGRTIIFTQMWELPGDLATARQRVVDVPTQCRGFDVSVQIRRGPKTGKTFAMVSLSLDGHDEASTDNLLATVTGERDGAFGELASYAERTWPGARLATSEFWESEVAFPVGMYTLRGGLEEGAEDEAE